MGVLQDLHLSTELTGKIKTIISKVAGKTGAGEILDNWTAALRAISSYPDQSIHGLFVDFIFTRYIKNSSLIPNNAFQANISTYFSYELNASESDPGWWVDFLWYFYRHHHPSAPLRFRDDSARENYFNETVTPWFYEEMHQFWAWGDLTRLVTREGKLVEGFKQDGFPPHIQNLYDRLMAHVIQERSQLQPSETITPTTGQATLALAVLPIMVALGLFGPMDSNMLQLIMDPSILMNFLHSMMVNFFSSPWALGGMALVFSPGLFKWLVPIQKHPDQNKTILADQIQKSLPSPLTANEQEWFSTLEGMEIDQRVRELGNRMKSLPQSDWNKFVESFHKKIEESGQALEGLALRSLLVDYFKADSASVRVVTKQEFVVPMVSSNMPAFTKVMHNLPPTTHFYLTIPQSEEGVFISWLKGNSHLKDRIQLISNSSPISTSQDQYNLTSQDIGNMVQQAIGRGAVKNNIHVALFENFILTQEGMTNSSDLQGILILEIVGSSLSGAIEFGQLQRMKDLEQQFRAALEAA
jgi:hypothetical protein